MKKLAPCMICLLLVVMLSGCGKSASEIYTINENHPLYPNFLEVYGDMKILLTAEMDFTDDGLTDLIVIYRENKSSNKLVALWRDGDEVKLSEPTPAPINNCKVEWKDIDNTPPIEMILSGSKGTAVGYAIYRFDKNEFLSLFGDGMEDCC